MSTGAVGWHRYGPRPYNYSVRGHPPLHIVRIQFFLTDLDKPDMANFMLIPGSHSDGFPRGAAKGVSGTQSGLAVPSIEGTVPGEQQIIARAGDILLFHNALWHAVALNTSSVSSRSLLLAYSPLWMRIIDRQESPHRLVANASPVRKQLLGALVGRTGGFGLTDEEAPAGEAIRGKDHRRGHRGAIQTVHRSSLTADLDYQARRPPSKTRCNIWALVCQKIVQR